MDIGLKPGEAAFSKTLQHGVFEVAGLVLEADVLIGKLPPHGDDLGDPAGGRVVADGVRRHDRDVLGDQPGIEAIVLGESAAGAGELPKPIGIDASHRQAGSEQGADDAALVTATRLKPDGGKGTAPQLLDERFPPRAVVRDRESLSLRQHHDIETVLRHIDSNEALLYHPRVPSLLMRVRALATVREWKKRLEHQAHSRPCHRGGYGLPVVVLMTPAVFPHRARLAEAAIRLGMPSVSGLRAYAETGSLISYGPSIDSVFERVADYVDRIARGTKAGELPIEQATRFEFVINLRTARALGLAISPAFVARADEVIE